MSSQVLSPTMAYSAANNTSMSAPLRNPLQQQKLTDRRVLHLNNRACVLVLSNGEYSEAIKLFDTALMIHKEQTEEGSNAVEAQPTPQPTYPQHEGCNNNNNHNDAFDVSCHSASDNIYGEDDCEVSDHDFSEEDVSETEFDEDFGDMDWDEKLVEEVDTSTSSTDSEETFPVATAPMHHYQQATQQAAPIVSAPSSPVRAKIPRITTASRLRTLNYCGQEEYHHEHGLVSQHHYHHQVYSLPIVMEESEWDTAPVQDKTFVLIFNTALCNHLWGMQLMQQYIAATTSPLGASNGEAVAALAEHCRETLTIAKLLYKLALENSVSFANGVDKMCYVALYNNLSHVLKTLEGYDSAEAQWCDDMLLKAIFWWRDSTNHHTSHHGSSSSGHYHASGSSGRSGNSSSSHHNLSTGSHSYGNSNSNSLSDMYLDDDAEIIDAFLENVYYRVGVPENIVPAAAA